jgi:RNA ligase
VWEHLAAGLAIEELLVRAPDELYDWVEGVRDELTQAFLEVEEDARRALDWAREGAGAGAERRELAAWVLRTAYPGLVFSLVDGRDISQKIWRMVRPEHARPFRVDADA